MYANFGRLASSSSVEFREDHVAEEEEDDDDNDEGEGLVRGRSRERKRMLIVTMGITIANLRGQWWKWELWFRFMFFFYVLDQVLLVVSCVSSYYYFFLSTLRFGLQIGWDGDLLAN